MLLRPSAALVLAGLLWATAGCDADAPSAAPSAAPIEATEPATTQVVIPAPISPPCDPSMGAPRKTRRCTSKPLTGTLTLGAHGDFVLAPFRTLHSDAEGEAYATAHGVEFPFSNDYYDAPTGEPRTIRVPERAICTGVIRVGYKSPLKDRWVDCVEFRTAMGIDTYGVPVAVWFEKGTLIQLSELYRP